MFFIFSTFSFCVSSIRVKNEEDLSFENKLSGPFPVWYGSGYNCHCVPCVIIYSTLRIEQHSLASGGGRNHNNKA